MLASTSLISCNFSSFPLMKCPSFRTSSQRPNPKTLFIRSSVSSCSLRPCSCRTTISQFPQKRLLLICQSTTNTQNSENPDLERDSGELGGNGSSPGGEGGNWTTSILLFLLWGGLMYYVFNLTPNQTPLRDKYFLEKLLNLKGDDGFRMNEVLVSLWYIMGLWPLVYGMLLLPTGRSSKSKIPVWPFVILSCFGGAYVLLPYFVLWRPPPPPVEETELRRWPLNFLESKLTAGVAIHVAAYFFLTIGAITTTTREPFVEVISLAAGLGIIIYAGLANGNDWKEFYQYFRESKFIHVTCIDFTLLSAFAPFWIYNDMTTRKWYDKGSWLLPLSIIPFLGPALYLLVRPSLATVPVSLSPSSSEDK